MIEWFLKRSRRVKIESRPALANRVDKMPTKETKDERRVKRVTNAINNPTSTLDNLQDAIDGVKHVKIYQDEIDAWVQIALKNSRYDMVLEIFNEKQISSKKAPAAVLRLFILRKPRYLKQFMESKHFKPECPFVFKMLTHINNKDIHLLKNFFSFPQTGDLLVKLRFLFSYEFNRLLCSQNPDIQQRIAKMKIILRFWFNVKRTLPAWRDSLYYPGSGPLYLKAFASFKRDMPCLLTCV